MIVTMYRGEYIGLTVMGKEEKEEVTNFIVSATIFLI